jgi:hypothetical protein
MDERIDVTWLQTSGTGRSMYATTYPPQAIRNIIMETGVIHNVPMHFAMMKLCNDLLISKSAERYFNKITRNNQGNVKNDNL